ncbi:MAG: DUF2807 domain-containing protein [Bacteroidia bacterium]
MKRIKTKKLKLAGWMLLSCISLQAQQTKFLENFTGINAGDDLSIIITQGDTNAITVNAPDNILPQIKTTVKNDILSIFTEGNIKSQKEISITITVKKLSSLISGGAANIKSSNELICDKLTVETNGSGDINLLTKATEINATTNGSGDIMLKGSAQVLTATSSGSGDINATNFEAKKVIAKTSGSGDEKVFVLESLTAAISGSGDIIYKGNPIDRNVNISGSGAVRESKSGTGEETAKDTTKIRFGNKKYMIIGEGDDDDDKKNNNNPKDQAQKFKHWNGIEVGINGYLNGQNNLNVVPAFLELDYTKSLQFGLNIIEKDFNLYKNYLNVITGLGFDFNHYSFENNISLKANAPYLTADNDTTIKYKKNTLNVSYLKAPLLLEVNTSKNSKQNLHIAAGMEFAYRIHSVTKQKFVQNGKDKKVKTRDDYNLEPFRFSAVARVGYNNVTIFANYALNRLFKPKQGPEVYPFTVGITFTL